MSKYVITTPHGRALKRTDIRGTESDAVAAALRLASPQERTLREAIGIEETHALRESHRVGTLWCNTDGTFAYERSNEPLLATIERDDRTQEYFVSGYIARTSGSYWYSKKELMKTARDFAGETPVEEEPDLGETLGPLWTQHSAIAFDDGEVRTTVVGTGRKHETTYVHVLVAAGAGASSDLVASLPDRATRTLQSICNNGRVFAVSGGKKRRAISFGNKDQSPRSARLMQVVAAAVEKQNAAQERGLS